MLFFFRKWLRTTIKWSKGGKDNKVPTDLRFNHQQTWYLSNRLQVIVIIRKQNINTSRVLTTSDYLLLHLYLTSSFRNNLSGWIWDCTWVRYQSILTYLHLTHCVICVSGHAHQLFCCVARSKCLTTSHPRLFSLCGYHFGPLNLWEVEHIYLFHTGESATEESEIHSRFTQAYFSCTGPKKIKVFTLDLCWVCHNKNTMGGFVISINTNTVRFVLKRRWNNFKTHFA